MTGIAGLPKLFPSLTAIVIAVPRPLLFRVLCWSTFGAIVAHGGKFRGWNVRLGRNWTFRSARAMSALPPKADIALHRSECPLCAKSRHSGLCRSRVHSVGRERVRGAAKGVD